MLNARLDDIASMIGVHDDRRDVTCKGVSTDSRSLVAGNLFVALNGPNFRGANFVAAAHAAGASAAVVDCTQPISIPQLCVDDTGIALQQLAKAWRERMSPTLIGITGSNGKTTMRSMVEACCGEQVLATEGNLNNDIGVPLTLLRMSPEHRFAVIEMGANHQGDIKVLTHMALPKIGIVTNAGPAHLEGFGSLQGVADGKGELFAALGAGDIAVINKDDEFFGQWCDMASPARIMSFGSDDSADVWFDDVSLRDGVRFTLHAEGEALPVTLQLTGAHNAHNACGAAAVALAAGIALERLPQALASVAPVSGRQRIVVGAHGGVIIDDTYNANPASMLAAASAAVARYDDVIMAIGDMGELGNDAIALHAQLGEALCASGVRRLLTLGPLAAHAATAFGINAHAFEDIDELGAALKLQLSPDTAVLVKGSRSMRMERLVALLRDNVAEAL